MKTIIEQPDTTALIQETAEIKKLATIKVTNAQEHGFAMLMLQRIAKVKTQIKEAFAPVRSAAKIAYDEVTKLEKSFLQPCDDADEALRNEVVAYDIKAEKSQRAAIEAETFKQNAPSTIADMIAPIEVQTTARVSGVNTRDVWKGEVTDKAAFLRYIVENGFGLIGLVDVPQGPLNKFAALNQGKPPVPGLKIWSERALTVRKS